MKVIGLTGGIGSGKSVVSAYLEELGAVLIDADKVGHEAFKPHTAAWHDVVEAFGNEVVTPNGEIDRAKLGGIVFNNPEKREKLNAIMRPRMKMMVSIQIANHRKKGAQAVVLEAEGLIEAGWQDLVDVVWTVISPEDAVIERLQQQRGLSREQIISRIRSQASNDEREKHADVIIRNDGSIDEMKARVKELWGKL